LKVKLLPRLALYLRLGLMFSQTKCDLTSKRA